MLALRARTVDDVALGRDPDRTRSFCHRRCCGNHRRNKFLLESQPLIGQQMSHAGIVCHLRKGSRIRTAPTAAAGSTIMGGFVRIVQTGRTMTADHDQRRQQLRPRHADRAKRPRPSAPFPRPRNRCVRCLHLAPLRSVRAAIRCLESARWNRVIDGCVTWFGGTGCEPPVETRPVIPTAPSANLPRRSVCPGERDA